MSRYILCPIHNVTYDIYKGCIKCERDSLQKQLTEAREKLRTDCPLATDGTCKDLPALEQENKRLRSALKKIANTGDKADWWFHEVAEKALKEVEK